MLLPANSGTIGTNHKFTAFIAVSPRSTSPSKIISHGLAGFEDEGAVVINRPNYAHGRWTERNQQAVAVFQHQFGQRFHTGRGRLYLQDDTTSGFQPSHLVH